MHDIYALKKYCKTLQKNILQKYLVLCWKIKQKNCMTNFFLWFQFICFQVSAHWRENWMKSPLYVLLIDLANKENGSSGVYARSGPHHFSLPHPNQIRRTLAMLTPTGFHWDLLTKSSITPNEHIHHYSALGAVPIPKSSWSEKFRSPEFPAHTASLPRKIWSPY